MARKCVGIWRKILISSSLVCFASERGQSLQMEQPPAEEILVAELQVHPSHARSHPGAGCPTDRESYRRGYSGAVWCWGWLMRAEVPCQRMMRKQ